MSRELTRSEHSSDFTATLSLGHEAERRFAEKWRRTTGEELAMNEASAIEQLRGWDCYSPMFRRKFEIKSDLRARDRLCCEHFCLAHTESDTWVQEFWEEGNFYAVPTRVIQALVVEDERRIRSSLAPLHQRVRGGQQRYLATMIPIREFLRLPKCQPI